ncbi:MAG: hypothetical protein KA251_01785 [Saprospiraceae bacterium]|nr:hypothetical protein [Candidatus Vicinibacter affinis]MBP6173332.1 hypothetical protein [Saprospiraceae bacterium]MBK6573702.1 hypothetical protein [Candidatus Vicinibacter affinis]MBK6823800.1 hypothetical protein [Candidatus Vicinibacter affinis]MBK7304453.1 hypothetical protein [Candidatus Vicinibacter affinis]
MLFLIDNQGFGKVTENWLKGAKNPETEVKTNKKWNGLLWRPASFSILLVRLI